MTVTCPVCKRRFHKGKTPEFKRLSRHLWRDHSDYMKRKIRSGQRKAKKNRESKLLDELQFTDDMTIQSLMSAGIPLQMPQQQQAYRQPPQIPIEHESLVGALLTGLALATASAKLAGEVRRVPKSKKKKGK